MMSYLLAFLLVSAPLDAQAHDDVRRLSAVVDYVGGDYGDAVRDGEIVSEEEYAEQLEFLDTATSIAGTLPENELDVSERLSAIRAMVTRKADASEVSAACRALRRDLLDSYGVVIAPTRAPDYARGAELFAQNCVTCHGPHGGGDGERRAELDPPPRSFQDPDVMSGLSPARAFNALTDGVPGTAMASFDTLSAQDRWSLAFYLFGLRFGSTPAMETPPVDTHLIQLAESSDSEITTWLESEGIDESKRAEVLAWTRTRAPYLHREGDPLTIAADQLAVATKALSDGKLGDARRAVIAAYLDGVEPIEPMLRDTDPELLSLIERDFSKLRRAILDEVPAAEFNQLAAETQEDLQRIRIALDRRESSAMVAFVSTLTVVLREGIEAVLLVLLLLGLIRRAGVDTDRRAAHAGWIAALGVGGIAWVASGALIKLGGFGREVLEGVIALFAAAVLIYASHFVLARMDAQRRVETLKQRFASASPAQRGLVLFSLAFVAVFREAFEVVLFLRAILIENSAHALAVLGGVGAGAVACLAVFPLARLIRSQLALRQVLTVSGSLLCVLAVVLAGKGVHALQEAGWVSITHVAFPQVDWLGLYPYAETLIVQALVIGVLVVLTIRGSIRKPAPSRSATS